jgi:putative ABC transport system permease protein
MIRNYLVVAVRNLHRYLTYTLINVLGLGLGMCCALLIFLLAAHHLSYDNYHPEADRIYRIVTENHRPEHISYSGGVPAPLGKALREDYTYTEKIARIVTLEDNLITVTENGSLKKFIEPSVAFAEPEAFDIFHLPLITPGSAGKLISDGHGAIITESTAKKLFGDKDPIGQVFRMDNRMDFHVTGVMQDLPDNTDLRSTIYLPYADLRAYNEWLASDDSWGGISSDMQCFVRLKTGVQIDDVEKSLFGYVKKFRPTSKNIHHYRLQPLAGIHTDTRYDGVMGEGALIALTLVGLFLIITACVNFINLATAQATSRSREVGVRKVLGGLRTQILSQFIAETLVITTASGLIALAVVSAFLPYLNIWFESRISINLLGKGWSVFFIPALVLFVTLAAGFYPGMILSGFKPAQALKGKLAQIRAGGLNLRRMLIVTQFSISQVLVIVLIVVIYQVNFSKEADLGFDREATIMIPVGSHNEQAKTLRAEIAGIAGVKGVSLCWSAPATISQWNTSVRFGNHDEDENFSISSRLADEHYVDLFGIELAAGRNIAASDTMREFLVNEKFAEKMGMTPESLIGEKIMVNGTSTCPIVGVVRNFHDVSFRGDIHPIFIGSSLENYNQYAVKINLQQASGILAAIESKWSATYPELIYSHEFLDDQVADFYRVENNILKLIKIFSAVAILVGCLGLFGLVSFMSIQKTKEIGIRKVLGGSIAQILWIFCREFSLLIVLAFVIAAPVGWLLTQKWLENYPYHITINAWIFIAAIGFTFLTAIITVGYRSLRAATANPVDSLRTE